MIEPVPPVDNDVVVLNEKGYGGEVVSIEEPVPIVGTNEVELPETG